jgi:hypothetical protein
VVEVDGSNHSDLTLRGSALQVMGDMLNFSSADLTQLDATEVELDVEGKSTLEQ